MKASELLLQLEHMGIDTIAGVPDSTLKQFCDGVQTYKGKMSHYVTANEGAAVGVAIGSYLATGRPACVYMQNSGIGNAVNPLASLANGEVYGIPMLFIVGWRGEPGVKDEPQHVFQGKITCQLFETLAVSCRVIDKETTAEEMKAVLREAGETLARGEQFALIVKKGTFEKESSFQWTNGNSMVREEVLGQILRVLSRDVVIVSTTGKISRELYERSDAIYGGHENIFMTQGGKGPASIMAMGIVAFGFGTAGGVVLAKIMNLFLKEKINPLIGSAGVSAVPMAARVSQVEGQKANPSNFLLMHAMGPNVAGVIGSAIAAGVMISLFG